MAYALSTSSVAMSDNEANALGLLGYPRSRNSTSGEPAIIRSRTWSEDITKTWNVPITGIETFEERVNRYLVYFTMTPAQLKAMLQKFRTEVMRGLEAHRGTTDNHGTPSLQAQQPVSLKMLETHITESILPRGTEKGSPIVLDVGGADVARARVVKVDMDGAAGLTVSEVSVGLREMAPQFPKGLMDRHVTASMLFDALADCVEKGIKEFNIKPPTKGEPIPLGVSMCFPLAQRSLTNATLVHWTKGFETGRQTIDPVEGQDVAAFLNCAFWRKNLLVKTKIVINDTTAALIAACYEQQKTPNRLPACRAAFVLGGGVNGCYIQPNAKELYGYVGNVINCELSGFDKSLPMNDVDLEVDFADDTTMGRQLFEKMTASTFLGELCRRLVVKVWQNEAPPLSWVRHSMPWLACARVVADQDPELASTESLLRGLWEWTTTLEERRTVRRLFEAVFDRSAALAAIAIAAIAAQTDRLQPAMGGVTVAVAGLIGQKLPQYMAKLREVLSVILGDETAKLIHLKETAHAAAKGAAVLTAIAVERDL